MSKSSTRGRLSHATLLGIKEMPTNTAWLMRKARQAKPATPSPSRLGSRVTSAAHSAAETAATSVAEVGKKIGDAGKLLTDATLGEESVAALIQRADAAAEDARQLETAAVQLAQQAKDEADTTAKAAAVAKAALRVARAEAEAMVDDHVNRA